VEFQGFDAVVPFPGRPGEVEPAQRLRSGISQGLQRPGPVLWRRRGVRRGARYLRGRLPASAGAAAPGTRLVMDAGVRAAVERALGVEIQRSSPLGGGDINDAFRVHLSDGRCAFVKQNLSAPRIMFPREARGLAFIDEA